MLQRRCGGYGFLTCRCGGDNCICANHGTIECPGCADCDDEDYLYDDGLDDDDELDDAARDGECDHDFEGY